MRTLVLGLVVALLATPVWAKVTIEVVPRPGELVADINYSLDGAETELVRAFALDITVSDGNIVGVGDYVVGDDNGGYGIFPANFSRYITVNANGEVDDWSSPDYTPVADGADPGALGGLGTNGITIEMGSLYETNAPGTSGRLCSITVSEDCHVALALNAMRGGVVMESAAAAGDVELIEADISTGPADCFPDTPDYALQHADWVRYGKPDCWCNSAVTGDDVSVMNYTAGDYQCDGDAATDYENPFLKYRVFINDLNLVIANWKLRDNAIGTPGGPDPCADVDHNWENPFLKYRVFINDLNIVVANWKKNAGALPGDCPRSDAAIGRSNP